MNGEYNQMKKERLRINYLDIAKAIAIFLVILGHSTTSTEWTLLRKILYSFHMPLFFAVSGVFVRTHVSSGYGWDHWKDFIVRNLKSLVFPYFAMAIIYSGVLHLAVPEILYGSWQMLKQAETLTSLWFLVCLFCARIMMEFVLMSSKKFPKIDRHLYAGIAAVVALIISFNLPAVEKGYPWCFNSAFTALACMLTGYALKDFLLKFQDNKTPVHLAGFLISAGLFAAGVLIQGEDIQIVKFHSNVLGNPFWFLYMAISGSAMALFLACALYKILSKKQENIVCRSLIWIGQNTKGIYLVHKPFHQDFIMIVLASLGMNRLSPLTGLLGSAITLPVSCVITGLINKYIPQIFGNFPETKKAEA